MDDIDPMNFLEASHEQHDKEEIWLMQQEMYNNQEKKKGIRWWILGLRS